MHSKLAKYKKRKPKFQSTKVFDGFSTVFRQWKATTTHCQFLHGYGVILVIAEDDPFKDSFLRMGQAGAAQVRVIDAVGAEKFAEFIYNKVNPFILAETDNRVKIIRVEFREHDKNSAIYEPGTN